MLKLWRVGKELTKPSEVEVDAESIQEATLMTGPDGYRVYDNTHYPTEAEAWVALRKKREGRIAMRGDNVREARITLETAEQRAADEAARFAEFLENERQWIAEQERLRKSI